MPGLEQVDPRKIWKNYVLALVVILSLVSVSHFASVLVGGDSQSMSRDINVSGRQGMLSQRILYYASVSQHVGYSDPEVHDNLEATVRLFERSHDELVAKANEPRLTQMYFDRALEYDLDQEVKRFLTDAHIVLDGPPSKRDAAVTDMQSFGGGDLLMKLDQTVHLYEAIATENAHRIKLTSIAGYILTLGALLFVAVFILRPSHQTIVRAFAQLQETQGVLEERERDAFSALEDAEEAWAEAEASRLEIEQSQSQAAARFANAGEELAAPLAALKAAIHEARTAGSSDERQEAARAAATFAEVTDQLRSHVMLSPQSEEDTKESFSLNAVCHMAVGTVSALGKDKAAISLSLPPQTPPPLFGDSLSMFRSLTNLLRDAQDYEGTGDIWLDVGLETEGQDATVSVAISQSLDTKEIGETHRLGLVDKKLTRDDTRALVVDELVASLDAQASVTWETDTRRVAISIPMEVKRLQTGKAAARKR